MLLICLDNCFVDIQIPRVEKKDKDGKLVSAEARVKQEQEGE